MVQRIFLPLLLVAMLLTVGGCGKPPVPSSGPAMAPAASGRGDSRLQKLEVQSRQWRGVPHRDGGLSKKGIDCSGLVFVTFRDLFGTKVPRSTKTLASAGRQVKRSQLQPADLVFFKTGWGKRHVGLYLSKGRFLHASKSKGVMVSTLNNPYWQKSYWQSRRLL